MALSILLHPPTALWRREALAASRGTFWVRMDGASSLRIYTDLVREPRCTSRRGERGVITRAALAAAWPVSPCRTVGQGGGGGQEVLERGEILGCRDVWDRPVPPPRRLTAPRAAG